MILKQELGLQEVVNTRIGSKGGSGVRISGGERKRVSIGIELIHRPQVEMLGADTSVMLMMTYVPASACGRTDHWIGFYHGVQSNGVVAQIGREE